MGADFISYLVFGPFRLSKSKTTMKRAKKKVTSFVALACQMYDLEMKAVGILADAKEADEQLSELMVENGIECTVDVAWARFYQDNPMKLVDELFDVWHNGSRDSAYRSVPGNRKQKIWSANRKQKIWSAGGMSWGDDPDGFGYQTMKKADQAGLLEIFGLG